ncbi:MAG TPA: MbcA/ParS/Xre antitoxin family protein [Terracidiphilus sp.]|nr:MbcA/ParS/Xre antitoxin family protein [Terracidiphilus sp.]
MATALMVPAVPGYSFDDAPDLSEPNERRRLSESAIKVFVNIARRWELNEAQARGLLGGVASSTFHAWRTKPKGKQLDQDTLTRISLVIGIYKALNIYFGKPWSDRWVTLKNRGPLFAGHAPIDYMLRQGLPGMAEVRRLLDAWRGGR